MKPKKITIAAGSFWPDIGGPASYARIVAPKLVEAGYIVDVVARSNKRTYREDQGMPYKIYRVKNWAVGPLNYFRYFLKLIRVAKDSDVIYALSPVGSGYPALWANWFLKKKLIVRIPGDYAWEQYSLGDWSMDMMSFQDKQVGGKTALLRKIQKKVAHAADKVVVSSEFLAGVVGRWGISKDKIEIIYNCSNIPVLNISKEEARNKIGIHGNIIISVGRLVPWKGFRMLVKIMPEIIKENQFFRLVIVGDGPEREPLRKMISNLGLENRVYLVGKKSQEELSLYLAASDVFVLNSLYESWPFQIIEAMAAGIPVIATNSGGIPEGIHQGENGFMVHYNDELNLIEAIRALHGDADIRNKFIKEGKKTAQQFTPKKTEEDTIKLVRSLL